MIDTKALRSRILDLAIQGKLTEQLESDGTAEELYQQIQEEKQKLIKDGKIKKEKPLPEINEEELSFDIPSHWKWSRMGNIFQHNTGKALNSSNTDGKLLEYITTSNVYWDRFELNILKKMYFSETEIEKCTVTKGDLLICEGGDIGRSAIWCYDYDIMIQNHIHRLRGYTADISVKFYYYLMWLYKNKGMIDGRGIGLQGFSSNRLHSLIIPVPPIAEQKRIVQRIEEIFRILDTIDEAQEKYSADVEILKSKLITAGIQGKLTQQLESDGTAEELYQQIQEEKQKLIKDGKIKKEKPLPPIKDEEIPFEIPSNWKWVRLGKIFTLQSGKNITSSQISDTQDSVYQYKCFGGNGVRGYVSDYNTIGEHALIGRQGALCGNINLAQDKFYATEHAVVVYQYCDMNVHWIVFALKELNLNQYATSVAQPGLAVGRIENVLIPLPPLAEQKRIAEKLGELLGALDN